MEVTGYLYALTVLLLGIQPEIPTGGWVELKASLASLAMVSKEIIPASTGD
jgi:hypothetical protein